MGIAERREREKEQRYNDIIDAAERVFFGKGFEQSTMDDVALEAELSKGTLYLYFKTKEDLFLAIHLRGLEIMEGLFNEAVVGLTTGYERIAAIGRAYIGFFQKYPEYFNTVSYYETRNVDWQEVENDENSIMASCLKKGDDAHEILRIALRDGVVDGSVRSDIDPFRVSMLLWGQTTGLIIFAARKQSLLVNKYSMQLEDLFEYYLQFMADSLRPRNAATQSGAEDKGETLVPGTRPDEGEGSRKDKGTGQKTAKGRKSAKPGKERRT